MRSIGGGSIQVAISIAVCVHIYFRGKEFRRRKQHALELQFGSSSDKRGSTRTAIASSSSKGSHDGKEERADSGNGSGYVAASRTISGSVPIIKIHDIAKLSDYSFEFKNLDNTRRRGYRHLSLREDQKVIYNKIINPTDYILNDIVRKCGSSASSEAFVRGGPRQFIHFDPSTVRAAIVTCGGLCPGLNNVIRELVNALYYDYDVDAVLGVVGGFHGFSSAPMPLTIDTVKDIHHQGGTILATSRGGFDLEVIIKFLILHRIDQLYIIGGDGTHRGAFKVSQEVLKRGIECCVAGIPKTIDNDLGVIDVSFGFETAVESARSAINSAKTEARCNKPNGIGIVKLMGRSAGYIASHATMASGDVDLCLIPEVPFELDGPNGCLPFLMERVSKHGHAVVVTAEGAGEHILGTNSAETDKSGNRKLPKIGEFLKDRIEAYFKESTTGAGAGAGSEATVKYIDPSYLIRSVPANAHDAYQCMILAQNAVHGAMAGYTNFTTGLVNNRVAYIPIPYLCASSPRGMDPCGRTWERVQSLTRQPNLDYCPFTAEADHEV